MLQTEFEFTLPRGLFTEHDGAVHRQGTMRLSTAKDELQAKKHQRVRQEPEYETLVLLAQVITNLGSISEISPEILENLFSQDLAYLREFFNRINQSENLLLPTDCPACKHHFTVDLALSGES